MKKKEEEYKDVPESERPEHFLDLKLAIDGPYGTPSDVSTRHRPISARYLGHMTGYQPIRDLKLAIDGGTPTDVGAKSQFWMAHPTG